AGTLWTCLTAAGAACLVCVTTYAPAAHHRARRSLPVLRIEAMNGDASPPFLEGRTTRGGGDGRARQAAHRRRAVHRGADDVDEHHEPASPTRARLGATVPDLPGRAPRHDRGVEGIGTPGDLERCPGNR